MGIFKNARIAFFSHIQGFLFLLKIYFGNARIMLAANDVVLVLAIVLKLVERFACYKSS